MKYGICGYGNLGKAVEKILYQNGEEIIGIFSRRNVKSSYGTKAYLYEQAKDFSSDIDVMIMCGGSQEDLIWQSPQMCKYFNIIDTFDTHARVQEHKQNLQLAAKENGHVAIYSCGWDPGLFSLIRALTSAIFNCSPYTFWGKGVSQGHSEALRNIKGIKDAIQFTIPNKDVIKKLKSPSFSPAPNEMHIRHCYICLDGSRSREEIENEIKQTENYFKNQQVIIEVCSQRKINSLKSKMFHKGMVISSDEDSSSKFSVKMENNPLFTAKIIYAYTKAIKSLPIGAYSTLDIPVRLLEINNNFNSLL